MSDLFDEFEFKPLTEGLGFHKKTEKPASSPQPIPLSIQLSTKPAEDLFSEPLEPLKDSKTDFSLDENDLLGGVSSSVSSGVSAAETSQSISDLIASLPPSLDFVGEKEVEETSVHDDRPQIFQPLARQEYNPTPKIPSASSVISGPQPLPPPGTKVTADASVSSATPSYRNQLDESFARSFPRADRKKEAQKEAETPKFEPVAAHFGAGILDAMVVTGIGTILLVCILLITKVNLVGLLNNAQTAMSTQIHLALLFLAVLQLYMLTARTFTGASLGEWAFDLQMGTDEDRKRLLYPLQAAWRMIVVTATGIVVLPLLSALFRRDLVKYLCGLQLYRRP